MNRCWALFLPLCCYLRLVSAEVSCDGAGAGSFPRRPSPHAWPPPPLPAVNFGAPQRVSQAPGTGWPQGLGGQVQGSGIYDETAVGFSLQ